MSQSVRAHLRNVTAFVHSSLDARASKLALDSRVDYVRFLEAHAAALVPLEEALEDQGIDNVLPDWQDRARAPALRADLTALNVAFNPLVAPNFETGEALLGAAYVLEGSRLGGQVLLGRVKEGKDPDILAATRYLRHGQGQRLWQTFQPQLENGASHNPEGAVEGALAAFRLFDHSFSQVLMEAIH
ncbi:MAG TPA: biliverdin-producing heme oxygenase [Rhizomicrobium sp.]|jgi:heme oxygenase|nr:biliverdin-producing heme oxygenase [Rhizomicrobium sp.]